MAKKASGCYFIKEADRDKNGKVTFEEYRDSHTRQVQASKGRDVFMFFRYFIERDLNEDGELAGEEYERLGDRGREADTDKNNSVTAREFRVWQGRLLRDSIMRGSSSLKTQLEAQQLIEQYDKDSNGILNTAELAAASEDYSAADKNGDKQITSGELLGFLLKSKKPDSAPEGLEPR